MENKTRPVDQQDTWPIKVTPTIKSFFTDIVSHMTQHWEDDQCSPFELRLADCIEAYGWPKAEERCIAYLRDLRECTLGAKQWERVKQIRQERKRQFLAGERSNLYEEQFPPNTY